MNRRLKAAVAALLLCAALAACRQKVEGVDLSGVDIDGIAIGMSADRIDLNRYRLVDAYAQQGIETIEFEELSVTIGADGGVIAVRSNAADAPARIDGQYADGTIEQIVSLLGENRRDGWYDHEQGLRVSTYLDYDGDTQAAFIYYRDSGEIVAVELSVLGGIQ